MADNPRFVQESIGAENTFTDWLIVRPLKDSNGVHSYFSVHVIGTMASTTVTTQYKRLGDDDSDAVDDATVLDANGLLIGELVGTYYVRAGVKTGDYGSGTATVRVTRE